jgi:predicted metal-dependent peptidase
MTIWEKLSLHDHIEAANTDCMRHPQFAIMGGVIMMGKWTITQTPTACTNGLDVQYGEKFCAGQDRKQLRYLVLHENGHKGLKHCVLPYYKTIAKKYPRLANAAQDYVINAAIHELDPHGSFVNPPVGALYDPKYQGMSFIQVLNDLIKQAQQQGQDPERGIGDGEPGDGTEPFDEHEDGTGELTEKEIDAIGKEVDDALRQGEQNAKRLRERAGNGQGGRDIFGLHKESRTDWRSATREWIASICEGDDYSRFNPRNKTYLIHDIVMPTHFTETTGDIIVACDTSGSMGWCYPIVFGEIARIAQEIKPNSIRIVWWDTRICGEQLFKQGEYENIAKLLKPKGGGGTTPAIVPAYIEEKEYKPQGVIVLTDGEFYGDAPAVFRVPTLWGVVNNENFVPPCGKVLHINEGE